MKDNDLVQELNRLKSEYYRLGGIAKFISKTLADGKWNKTDADYSAWVEGMLQHYILRIRHEMNKTIAMFEDIYPRLRLLVDRQLNLEEGDYGEWMGE